MAARAGERIAASRDPGGAASRAHSASGHDHRGSRTVRSALRSAGHHPDRRPVTGRGPAGPRTKPSCDRVQPLLTARVHRKHLRFAVPGLCADRRIQPLRPGHLLQRLAVTPDRRRIRGTGSTAGSRRKDGHTSSKNWRCPLTHTPEQGPGQPLPGRARRAKQPRRYHRARIQVPRPGLPPLPAHRLGIDERGRVQHGKLSAAWTGAVAAALLLIYRAELGATQPDRHASCPTPGGEQCEISPSGSPTYPGRADTFALPAAGSAQP
jgi:hypothetical protein